MTLVSRNGVCGFSIDKVTAHVQNDGLEEAQEICTDSTYFPNNLRT